MHARHSLPRSISRSIENIQLGLVGFLLMIPLTLVDFVSADAQTIVSREVVAGGGGTLRGGERIVRGTLSQTAVGVLARPDASELQFAGFWHRAYRPEAVTTLSLPRIETTTRSRVVVELRLETTGNRSPFTPRPFTIRIRFNSTLLHPLEGTPACSYDGDDCIIEISDTARLENGVIARIPFITALGNAESTPLRIESVEWDKRGEERIRVEKIDGELLLLDVCREGEEVRTIRSGPVARLAIHPNPTSGDATLDLTPNESGPVTIRLVDPLGAERLRFPTVSVEAGRHYPLQLSLSSLPSGVYTLLVQTPSGLSTKQLIIQQ